jgi:hypothetical protein
MMSPEAVIAVRTLAALCKNIIAACHFDAWARAVYCQLWPSCRALNASNQHIEYMKFITHQRFNRDKMPRNHN